MSSPPRSVVSAPAGRPPSGTAEHDGRVGGDAERPDRMSGLALLPGCYHATARPDASPFPLSAIPMVGAVLAPTASPLFGAPLDPAAIGASFAPAPVSREFAHAPMWLMLRPSQVRATAADTALMIPGAADLSHHYGKPVLPEVVMAGEGDLIAPVDGHGGRFALNLAASELRIVPGRAICSAMPYPGRSWQRSGRSNAAPERRIAPYAERERAADPSIRRPLA